MISLFLSCTLKMIIIIIVCNIYSGFLGQDINPLIDQGTFDNAI